MTTTPKPLPTHDTRIGEVLDACAAALLDVYLTVYDRIGLDGELELIREVCTQQATIAEKMTDRALAVTRRPRFWLVRAGSWLHFGGRCWAELDTARWFLDLMDTIGDSTTGSLSTAQQYAQDGQRDLLARHRTLVLNNLWNRYAQAVNRRVR